MGMTTELGAGSKDGNSTCDENAVWMLNSLNGHRVTVRMGDNGPNEKAKEVSLGLTQAVVDAGYVKVNMAGFFETEMGKDISDMVFAIARALLLYMNAIGLDMVGAYFAKMKKDIISSSPFSIINVDAMSRWKEFFHGRYNLGAVFGELGIKEYDPKLIVAANPGWFIGMRNKKLISFCRRLVPSQPGMLRLHKLPPLFTEDPHPLVADQVTYIDFPIYKLKPKHIPPTPRMKRDVPTTQRAAAAAGTNSSSLPPQEASGEGAGAAALLVPTTDISTTRRAAAAAGTNSSSLPPQEASGEGAGAAALLVPTTDISTTTTTRSAGKGGRGRGGSTAAAVGGGRGRVGKGGRGGGGQERQKDITMPPSQASNYGVKGHAFVGGNPQAKAAFQTLQYSIWPQTTRMLGAEAHTTKGGFAEYDSKVCRQLPWVVRPPEDPSSSTSAPSYPPWYVSNLCALLPPRNKEGLHIPCGSQDVWGVSGSKFGASCAAKLEQLTGLYGGESRKWNYPPTICELFISLAPVDLKDVKNFSMRNADLFKAARLKLKATRDQRIKEKAAESALELAEPKTAQEIHGNTDDTRSWKSVPDNERAVFEELETVEQLKAQTRSAIRLIEFSVRSNQDTSESTEADDV